MAKRQHRGEGGGSIGECGGYARSDVPSIASQGPWCRTNTRCVPTPGCACNRALISSSAPNMSISPSIIWASRTGGDMQRCTRQCSSQGVGLEPPLTAVRICGSTCLLIASCSSRPPLPNRCMTGNYIITDTPLFGPFRCSSDSFRYTTIQLAKTHCYNAEPSDSHSCRRPSRCSELQCVCTHSQGVRECGCGHVQRACAETLRCRGRGARARRLFCDLVPALQTPLPSPQESSYSERARGQAS